MSMHCSGHDEQCVDAGNTTKMLPLWFMHNGTTTYRLDWEIRKMESSLLDTLCTCEDVPTVMRTTFKSIHKMIHPDIRILQHNSWKMAGYFLPAILRANTKLIRTLVQAHQKKYYEEFKLVCSAADFMSDVTTEGCALEEWMFDEWWSQGKRNTELMFEKGKAMVSWPPNQNEQDEILTKTTSSSL